MNALGLPKGSVRAILALVSSGATLAMLWFGLPVPEWWPPILAMMLGWYFKRDGSRND